MARNLTKKTTILFSPELYQQLVEIAKLSRTSVAQLIRRAVIERYLLSDKKRRVRAVKELSEIGGTAAGWRDIEDEIIEGKVDDTL